MDTWFFKQLGDGMIAPDLSDQIREIFLSQFEAAGSPKEMAIFTRYDSEGRLHCDVMAYFSPAAAEIAETFSAMPCAKPPKAGLGLLAGDPDCWSILFPENR
jgi:hypothetical protein